MSRDLQKKRPSPARKSARGGTVLGIFIGLIIGILIALAVVWYMNRTPAPFVNKPQQGEPVARNGSGAPVALPAKPGDAPQEKRFQFYDILPGKSEPKPDAKPGDRTAPPTAKVGGPNSLQVGSYQNPKDAENQKASLTLAGFEPTVEEAKVADKTWYRVRLGPFANFEEMNKVKTSLAKNGVQAVVVKSNE